MEISAALWVVRLGKDFTFFRLNNCYCVLTAKQSHSHLFSSSCYKQSKQRVVAYRLNIAVYRPYTNRY